MGYTDDYIQERYEEEKDSLDLPVYSNPEAQRFVIEALDQGFEPRHYNGRSFFEGPAIDGDDLVELIRAVSVDVQYDNLGRGYIVYGPRDKGTWEEND